MPWREENKVISILSLCLCSAFLRVLCVSALKFRPPTLRLRHSTVSPGDTRIPAVDKRPGVVTVRAPLNRQPSVLRESES